MNKPQLEMLARALVLLPYGSMMIFADECEFSSYDDKNKRAGKMFDWAEKYLESVAPPLLPEQPPITVPLALEIEEEPL